MTRSRRILFRIVALGLVLAFGELVSWFVLAKIVPDWDQQRRAWSGQGIPTSQQYRMIGQPYLLMVPCPGWTDGSGVVQHNMQGFRGAAVPLARTPGVARVLCLGGSTTYGTSVPLPEQSYPAVLESLLKRDVPRGWSGVEVINAGAAAAASSEHLTYYEFKFRYFKPDVLVLEVGGNDGYAETTVDYQPDYSHLRQEMRRPQQLGVPGRWIARTHLGGLFLAILIRGNETRDFTFKHYGGPTVRWYERGPDERDANPAYRRNIEAICTLAAEDGVKILLMPFRARPDNSFSPEMRAAVARNEEVTKEIAAKRALPLAPMPAGAIGAGHWADDTCHLNPDGERDKAAHVEPFVRKLLEK